MFADSAGDLIFLALDQKGKFSPVAREDNISGVHSVKNLLHKRLPLSVRLVHGDLPEQTFRGFQPQLRLLQIRQKDYLLGTCLLKESVLSQLPLDSNSLKLVPPSNTDFLISISQYKALCDKYSHLSPSPGTIGVLSVPHGVQGADDENRANCCGDVVQGHRYDHKRRFQSNCKLVKKCIANYQQQKVSSSCSRNHHPHLNHPRLMESRHASSSPSSPFGSPGLVSQENQYETLNLMPFGRSGVVTENPVYEEIDQIYDYIRGTAPLPLSVTNGLLTTACNSSATPFKRSGMIHQDTHYFDPRRLSYPIVVGDISHRERHQHPHQSRSSGIKSTNCTSTVPVKSSPPPAEKLCEGSSRFFSKSANSCGINSCGSVMKGSSRFNSSSRVLLPKARITADPDPKGDPPFSMSQTVRSCRSSLPSPIFNIRYKSLTDLHLPQPKLPLIIDRHDHSPQNDNTLGSSNSGRQTSSSKDPFKDPKAKTRRLSKPKSLSSLFWDFASAFTSFDHKNKNSKGGGSSGCSSPLKPMSTDSLQEKRESPTYRKLSPLFS